MIYTILNFLEDILGGIFVSFVCLYAVLGVVYKVRKYLRRKKKLPEAVIRPKEIPLLRPIPIPTKNEKGLMRILVWLFEVRSWSLEENWFFNYHDGSRTVRLVFGRGFQFDGASIPRIFWFFLSPVGLLLIPGLIHDYAYKYDQLWEIDNGVIKAYDKGGEDSKRRRWDRQFWAVGVHVNGLRSLTFVAWLAIKIGGYGAWKTHREKNKVAPIPVMEDSEARAGGA